MTPRAVVTGAARGIGRAITEALVAAGFHVYGIDLRALPYDHPHVTKMHCDLTNQAAVMQCFANIQNDGGGVDVLVNNAGGCVMEEFLETTADQLHAQMAMNYDSAFYCCQAAIPQMLERPGIKKIVNISSNGAYNFDVFDPAPYRASKAAIDTLTKHLARKYANQGICVNSIAPAMTRTDLFDVVSPEVLAQALAGMPMGTAIEATQIAAWVAFLASAAGDCSSGNVIILNKGRDVR
jgi:NAD(P)-dependent dehydrogenase (short-subunit alcohol dehydrogenase family)